ncbi:MAG: glycosyltransferase family 2 protein [Paracoccaceae bacterium]|nr:glycosyltransferase family 2 protein [Paracoccaceae bacterium]
MTSVSVVIPIKNEAENIRPLIDEIVAALEPVTQFEVIVVNDGSTDSSSQVVRHAMQTYTNLLLLEHASSAGQSAAVHSGVLAAKTPLIATLDGDGQNPPENLPSLLAPFLEKPAQPQLGLVAGQRVGRQDRMSKKIASKLANGLRGFLLQDGTRDTGCGLKAFRREAFLQLPYFNHMHRYLPALFKAYRWDILHVDVSHAARSAGQSNYSNLQRAVVGAIDLFGVMWLVRRAKRAQIVKK